MPPVVRGTCHIIFVYDIAFSIDLNETERHITSAAQRETVKHRRRAPRYFDYHPAPLRISQEIEPTTIAEGFKTSPQLELVAYDFGAVSVIYRIPFTGELSSLISLSSALYENEQLLANSRERVEKLLALIRPAVSRANVSTFVEDYVVFHIEARVESVAIDQVVDGSRHLIAQILRAEARQLSDDEVNDALSHRIAYGTNDVAILDWNAALVIDKEPEDVLTVLEFANVELLEMRFLDRKLDEALAQAYERLSKRSRKWFAFRFAPSDLEDISRWQVDNAILFEGVNNVLKLLGDQYLARLYRLIAQRFHLMDWDASILRKLETLGSIYEKLSDRMATRRMEVLEWIIILLFVISILLPFFAY